MQVNFEELERLAAFGGADTDNENSPQSVSAVVSATVKICLQFEEILFAKRDNERGTLEYARFEEEKKMFDDVQKNILPGELFEKSSKY